MGTEAWTFQTIEDKMASPEVSFFSLKGSAMYRVSGDLAPSPTLTVKPLIKDTSKEDKPPNKGQAKSTLSRSIENHL